MDQDEPAPTKKLWQTHNLRNGLRP
ncbi:hypothetical protein CCACVL1_02341 [Corchorus capsularis]|uniref:Uncharacterized protein n=1 Tax=Corchorus capsularis TaxID=210143 RepID=A0A1R3K956_COCAP|nr:hypothetical protein CCACVL1_02341 [Corchorus capsularis]